MFPRFRRLIPKNGFPPRSWTSASWLSARLPACLLACLLACMALALAACSNPPMPRGPKVLQWGVVEIGDIKRVLEASAVVKARSGALVRVGSRMGGQISKLYVRTGEIVRQGQLLALIDDRELQTQRSACVARLEGAKAELQRQESTRGRRLDEARANLASNRDVQEYAGKNMARRDVLYDQGNLQGNAMELARRDSKTADQGVASGQAVLERITRETAREIEKAAAAVQEAQAALDFTDARLALTRIESPIEGIVGQVVSQEGEQVVAELEAVHILTVVDPRFLELWVYINEADAAGVRPGMPVRFFKAATPHDLMAAQVERVSPVPETLDGVRYYPAIAMLDPKAAFALRPEMNVQSYVLVDFRQGALTVPRDAVIAKGGAKAVSPRLGLADGLRVEVLEGLAQGQRVAVKIAPETITP